MTKLKEVTPGSLCEGGVNGRCVYVDQVLLASSYERYPTLEDEHPERRSFMIAAWMQMWTGVRRGAVPAYYNVFRIHLQTQASFDIGHYRMFVYRRQGVGKMELTATRETSGLFYTMY